MKSTLSIEAENKNKRNSLLGCGFFFLFIHWRIVI